MKVDVELVVVMFLVGIVVGMFVFDGIDKHTDGLLDKCWRAELSEANVIWQDSNPFCMVKVDVNGEDKLFTAKEYNSYIDLVGK